MELRNDDRQFQSIQISNGNRQVNLTWQDLSYNVYKGAKTDRKKVLSNLNGECRSGELMAIMGPSGAGKTTLLNVLAGYKVKSVTGTISVNGKPRDLNQFRKLSSYILQDQYLLSYITVMEAMMVSVNLNLPEKMSKDKKLLMVNEILHKLGLTKCLKTLIGQLSGGERKRLSIAVELVRNPPIMFFDEPTSGLDSNSCSHCIGILKDLASGSRTIICSIHQPSAKLLEMFDSVYFVADGTCVYSGSVKNIVPYLETFRIDCPTFHNPSDILMDVSLNLYGNLNRNLRDEIQNGSSKMWLPEAKGLKVSADNVSEDSETNKTDEIMSGTTTGFINQFKVLYVRSAKFTVRNPLLTAICGLCQILFAVSFGIVYWDVGRDASKVVNNIKCLSLSLVTFMLLLQLPSILVFNREAHSFLIEHLNCWYNVKSYYWARLFSDLPIKLCFTLAFSSILYFMTGQPNDPWRFSMFLTIMLLYATIAQAISIFIGASFSRLEYSLLLTVFYAFWVFTFSGIPILLKDVPAYFYWISYTSYVQYGFGGTMLAIYGYGRGTLECDDAYCYLMNPEEVLQIWGFADSDIYLNIGILFIFIVLANAFTYTFLHLKVYFSK